MSLSTRKLRAAFLVALALGLVLRLAFVGTPGFPSDVATFQAWAERLRQVGPGAFYAPDYFSDYPPAFLYVLWGGAALLGGMPAIVAKALSIPFDLAIAIALYAVLRRVADERAGVAAATLYLLNPALVLAGTYWGQSDAVGTLPFLLALVAASFGRFTLAGASAGLAFMVKPQFGLALIAVGAAALVDLVRNGRAGPLLRVVAGAAVVTLVLALPFRLDLGGLVDLVAKAAATYQYTSLFAFNVWAILADFWKPDDQLFLGVALQYWSALLFAAGVLATLALLWRDAPRGRRWGSEPASDLGLLLAVGALLAFAFYFLPTRVHERYLFPAFALTAPFAALHRRAFAAYLALATFFFLTLFYAFTRYPQTATRPPDFLEATLYQRVGVIALSLAGMAVAGALAWWWARGEERGLVATAPALPKTPAMAPAAVNVPHALRAGGRPTGRDLRLALLLALLVLLTRGVRVDWPRDMYFDEVYHARTAMELLAGREPYEWTHPHLAKEIMAMSILLFGDVRAIGTSDAPVDVVAYTADGEGRRAYVDREGALWIVDRELRRRSVALLGPPTRALALDGDRAVVASARDLTEVVLSDPPAVRAVALPDEPRSLVVGHGEIVLATAREILVYARIGEPTSRIPLQDTVAVHLLGDGSTAYVAASDGTVRLVSLITGETQKTFRADARVATMTVEPGSSRVLLGDASEPILHSIDLEGGGVEHVRIDNARIAPFGGPPLALATSPRTRLSWVLGRDGVAVVEPHGVAAFAVVREAEGARSLAIDDERDRVVAAAGTAPVEISAGRVAFAWRFPGVVAGAVLAFFLFLLARRLFAERLVAYALGLLVLIDGAMFAQSRIGMNDVYVGAGIVAGWYFVVAALSADARRPGLDLLLAGVALGLGLAAKWAAGPALLAVGLVSLVVSARAFIEDRPGKGGPFDLLARRGLNALYLALCFVAVPLAIYLVSYVPWFGLGHGITSSSNGGWSLLELQRQMFSYHSQLTAPHPAGSPWWAWPLDLKPVYWQYAQASPTTSTYIYDAGNLVTWWAAIPAMAFVVYQAARTRAAHLAVLVLAFATQYLEWIPVSRVLFQYHFFTALPFYLLALAAALSVLYERPERRRWVVGILVAGALWFAWFYPWLSAVPVPGMLANLYFWLPTWQYGCQFYPSFRCT